MEWKRIFNRKTWLFILGLCFVHFGCLGYREWAGINFSDMKETRRQWVADLDRLEPEEREGFIKNEGEKYRAWSLLRNAEKAKQEDPQGYLLKWKEEIEGLKSEQPEYVISYEQEGKGLSDTCLWTHVTVMEELCEELDYLFRYQDNISQIAEKAQGLGRVSIFKPQDSGTDGNISKTVADYERIAALNVEYAEDSSQPIVDMLKNTSANICYLLLLMALVLQMYSERACGMWGLTYSCPRGRIRFGLQRLAILLAGSVAGAAVLYGGTLTVGLALYGNHIGMNRYIQSISEFQDFTIPMRIWQFLLFFLFWKILAGVTAALLMLAIAGLFKNGTVQMIIMVAIVGAEYYAYQGIAEQSPYRIFKWCNIFQGLLSEKMIVTYRNIPILGHYVGKQAALLFAEVGVSVLLVASYLFICAFQKPVCTEGFLVRQVKKMAGHLRSVSSRILEQSRVSGMELYKLMVLQRGWVLLAAVLATGFLILPRHQVYYSGKEMFLKDFYTQMGGVPDEKVRHYLEEQQEIADREAEAFQKAQEQYFSDEIDGSAYEQAVSKFSAYREWQDALDALFAQLSYLDGLKEERGIQGHMIPGTGYVKLFSQKERSLPLSCMEIICLILAGGGLFAMEAQTGLRMLLHTTAKGRRVLFQKKMAVISVTACAIWLAFSVSRLYYVWYIYGFEGLHAPIQSIQEFGGFPLHLTVFEFMVCFHIVMLVKDLSAAYLAACISAHSRRIYISLLVGLAAIVFPYIAMERNASLGVIATASVACIVAGIAVGQHRWVRTGRSPG